MFEFKEKDVKEEINNLIDNFLPKKRITAVIRDYFERSNLTDLHSRAKSVYPNCFAGAKIVATREILRKMKLVQQYNYGVSEHNYRSFCQFIHRELENPSNEGIKVDTSGVCTATYYDQTNDFNVKLSTKLQHETFSEIELTLDRSKNNSASSFTFMLKDMDPRVLRIISQYLYEVSPNLYLGGEMSVYPFTKSFPDMTLCGRYDTNTVTFSSSFGSRGVQVCAYKRLKFNLRIASIIDYGYYTNETVVSLAVQNKFHGSNCFKVFVDSNQCGGMTYEKDVYIKDPSSDVKVLKIIGSLLVDSRKKVNIGLGFYIDL